MCRLCCLSTNSATRSLAAMVYRGTSILRFTAYTFAAITPHSAYLDLTSRTARCKWSGRLETRTQGIASFAGPTSVGKSTSLADEGMVYINSTLAARILTMSSSPLRTQREH